MVLTKYDCSLHQRQCNTTVINLVWIISFQQLNPCLCLSTAGDIWKKIKTVAWRTAGSLFLLHSFKVILTTAGDVETSPQKTEDSGLPDHSHLHTPGTTRENRWLSLGASSSSPTPSSVPPAPPAKSDPPAPLPPPNVEVKHSAHSSLFFTLLSQHPPSPLLLLTPFYKLGGQRSQSPAAGDSSAFAREHEGVGVRICADTQRCVCTNAFQFSSASFTVRLSCATD